jgi:hypothetical protein
MQHGSQNFNASAFVVNSTSGTIIPHTAEESRVN